MTQPLRNVAIACELCATIIIASLVLAQSPAVIARSVSSELGSQGRLLWVDGTANVTRTKTVNGVTTVSNYTTTIDGVREVVQHAKSAHVNTLVIDVKPLSGQVLYDSKVAPHMRTWKGHELPDFDVLAAFVSEGHKAGLQVDADINILSEGHKYFNVGPAYDHPEWQSIVYTVDRGLYALNGSRLSVRTPNEPDDPNKPTLLDDASSILGSEPNSGMVGLESTESRTGVVTAGTGASIDKQLNVVIDSANRIAGMVDSALLGDDPLIAPDNGHLLTITKDADRLWAGQNLQAGQAVRFDLQTQRVPIAQAPSEKVACFVNPLVPEARKHELDIVREIVTNYDVDGLVLDRCRYSNLYNDYSDRTRDDFGEWLKAKRRNTSEIHNSTINRWPQDVFSFSPNPGGPVVEGPLYKLFLEYRAHVIRDFVGDVAKIVRTVKPRIALGTYVGSWYPKYYEVGVNWGSEKTRLRYNWFTPDYPQTAYANYFDWISTGCYYPIATEDEARDEGLSPRGTVEYAAELSNLAVSSSAFVYAGIYVPDYAGKPDEMVRALNAAAHQTQGWMIFDTSQIDEYDLWPFLAKSFAAKDFAREPSAPDHIDNLLTELRSAFDEAEPQ